MNKEILTSKNIQQDLYSILIRDLLRIPVAWFLFILTSIPLNMFLNSLKTSTLLLDAFIVFLALYTLFILVYFVFLFWNIKNFKIKIRKSRLLSKKDYKPGGTKWNSYKPYTLIFDTYNKCEIVPKIHYKWSTAYSMNEHEVFNSSNPNDEFLLIFISKKKIALVYNLSIYNYDETLNH